MKKSALTLAVLLGLAVASCSGNGNNSSAPAQPVAASATGESTPSLNIRYIDADSLTSRYNLAIDFREVSIRAFSKLENARQSRAAEIQRFGNQIEEKMRSNGYLSEASYNADVAKFNKMQQDAQAHLENLQRTTEQELAAQQQQLNDSIESFIKAYNATKGFDAILYKAAGVYFNPALDITDEVIEGLNARYNRVTESK
ncbi:MAG: OmpH family outer membrane protein [Bacteroides sp.]|nr:OmpH family outer membrane protein [Bacteroides sp.]MBD5331857.1 OmpH family outer membrane protein [Bacteroides sp.]MBD5375064.1 OmpH family outer membrane protein [Bacteroides sp.]MBD5375517.1 OmpH family outer membrane protein [Bacteroides sp.]MDE7459841.1 OmpH family outer membrane protein [Paramuribaculum sp.]